MVMLNKTISGRNGSNGFWSGVSSGLGEAVGGLAQLAPVWAAKELDLQSIDQLNASTFDGSNAPPRIDDQRRSTGESAIERADDTLLGIDRTALMIVGGGLLIAGIVFAVAR